MSLRSGRSCREGIQREQLFYEKISTAFGAIAVVWWNAAAGPRIRQIILCGRRQAAKVVRKKYPAAQLHSASEIDHLRKKIQRFLEGEAVEFDLGMMGLERCGEFQRKILLSEYAIPRGWISTYGRLAEHIGVTGGGRAAGRALAENPFPLVIPCHRAVRADGGIGGFQGGVGMKRALLAMEGVKFLGKNRISMERVCY